MWVNVSLKVSDLNHNVRKLCPKEESKNCFKNTQSVKIADSDNPYHIQEKTHNIVKLISF